MRNAVDGRFSDRWLGDEIVVIAFVEELRVGLDVEVECVSPWLFESS